MEILSNKIQDQEDQGRHCEKTLRAERRQCKRAAKEKDVQVNFCPHLLAEECQQQFDGDKAQFQAMNSPYGLLYPAHYSRQSVSDVEVCRQLSLKNVIFFTRIPMT